MQRSQNELENLRLTSHSLKKQLVDFPKTEIWRLQTDGWQHIYGPKNFREEYYKGIQEGFKFIEQHLNEKISADLIMGLYQAAGQFEKFYNMFQIYDAWGGEFSVILVSPDSKSYVVAGVSEEGLANFASALREGYRDETIQLRIYPSMDLKPDYKLFYKELGDKNDIHLINPAYFKSDQDLINHIRFYLMAAGKDDELRESAKKDPSINYDVSNITYCRLQGQYYRENALEIINEKLNEFYAKLSSLQPHPDNERIMELIVELVRSFHQKHILNDGNGRTFITLLSRWLFLQNDLPLGFINTPSHFAGFSTKQLTTELLDGIKQFQEYCVTKAKKVLANLSLDDVDKTQQIKESLLMNLSKDPIIALSQINELFVQIETNEFKVPPNYLDSRYSNFQSYFNKNIKIAKNIHNNILSLLKSIYLEKIQLLTQDFENKPCEGFTRTIFTDTQKTITSYSDREVFGHLIEAHGIIYDKKYSYPENHEDNYLKEQIDLIIDKYFREFSYGPTVSKIF